MGRNVSASAFGLRKCISWQHPAEDRISLLPDEILMRILSSLTFKEAGRTSILSKRWIHLWTYVTCLDFDASTALHNLRVLEGDEEYFDSLEWEQHKYANWVNKVLNAHRALVVKKFRICCDLDDTFQEEIDGWLQYGFARKVRRLEVNLLEHLYRKLSSKNCTFPSSLVGLKNCKSTGGNFSCDFQSLKTLILKSVDVSGEVLESLLHNFKSLKRLVVFRSEALVNLEVSSPSLALRHLAILGCPKMKSLSVCNANIISLKIDGPLAILVLKNAPMLIDVGIDGISNLNIVTQISSSLSKLEILSLDVLLDAVTELGATFAEASELTRLKMLSMVVMDGNRNRRWAALRLASLFRFTPNLEKLKIEFRLHDHLVGRRRSPRIVVDYPLQHLRVVELSGYSGHANELGLVNFFLRNAGDSLEEIIIHPRPEGHPRSQKVETGLIRRKRAEQQFSGLVLPSRVKFIIL